MLACDKGEAGHACTAAGTMSASTTSQFSFNSFVIQLEDA